MGKTYYYTDELHDDFAGTHIDTKPLPEDYEYLCGSGLRRGFAWFLHHIVVTPVCYLYLKLSCGQKIVGREKLRPYRKSGFFLYGNHTRKAGDAFTPTMVAFPRKPFVLVNRDAISIRGIRRLVEDLGGMPVPDSYSSGRKFCTAVRRHMAKGGVIAVYPEAHIWPLYTGIRAFTDVSFAYPVETGKPAFAFTVAYRKRRVGGVKATVYVDGPFFPDESLPKREQKARLRNEVYAAMAERSRRSVYSPNRFVKCEGEAGANGETFSEMRLDNAVRCGYNREKQSNQRSSL